MQIFHAYSLILRKRSRILRENHFIKICVNHPVGQHVLHPFPHQPHYGLLSPGQHPAKLWRCIQFLFRPLTIRLYQRRFIQIFPYIISAALMYKGIRAHAYIYIIKITIGHLDFMLLHRQRAGNPLQARHTRIA